METLGICKNTGSIKQRVLLCSGNRQAFPTNLCVAWQNMPSPSLWLGKPPKKIKFFFRGLATFLPLPLRIEISKNVIFSWLLYTLWALRCAQLTDWALRAEICPLMKNSFSLSDIFGAVLWAIWPPSALKDYVFCTLIRLFMSAARQGGGRGGYSLVNKPFRGEQEILLKRGGGIFAPPPPGILKAYVFCSWLFMSTTRQGEKGFLKLQ